MGWSRGHPSRTAGLSVAAALSDVRRRRVELRFALLLVVAGTTLILALSHTSKDLLPAPFDGTYDSWIVMVLVTGLALSFLLYVLEKEGQLRTLKEKLLEERARTAALANRLSELTRLSELGKAVNSVLGMDDVMQTILASALELIGGTEASVMLVDEDGNDLSLVSYQGPNARQVLGARVGAGEGISGSVAKSGRPLLLNEEQPDDAARSSEPRARIHSAMCVPLIRRDEVVGVLNVNETEGKRRFTENDLSALGFFAEHAAVAIANARLYEKQRESMTKMAELDRVRSDFVSTVSHQLRTPLTGVIGAIKTLGRRLDELPPEQRKEFMSIAERQGDRLLRLVEDILAVVRVEEEGLRLTRELVDLYDMTMGIVQEVSHSRIGRGRRIITEFRPDRPKVWGDRAALSQVLMNLIDNALKYSPEDKPVHVRIHGGLSEAVLQVQDQGPGIPEEQIPVVFEKFRRIETKATRSAQGTGLGLYIVRKLVEAHGGTMEVDSRVGSGSTFTMRLPERTSDRDALLADSASR